MRDVLLDTLFVFTLASNATLFVEVNDAPPLDEGRETASGDDGIEVTAETLFVLKSFVVNTFLVDDFMPVVSNVVFIARVDSEVGPFLTVDDIGELGAEEPIDVAVEYKIKREQYSCNSNVHPQICYFT